MATERQIAANRANSLRSTGPKTLAGRSKSGRNAYRHGLSLNLASDPSIDKVKAIAHVFVGEGAEEGTLETVEAFVQAQLLLLRIRAERKNLAETIDLAGAIFRNSAVCSRWTATNVTL
jgi:hypothetical protein